MIDLATLNAAERRYDGPVPAEALAIAITPDRWSAILWSNMKAELRRAKLLRSRGHDAHAKRSRMYARDLLIAYTDARRVGR